MLDLLFGRPGKKAYSDGWWPTGRASGRLRTQAGVVVDEDLALTYAAVWCATRVLVESISSLPLFTYERKPGDLRGLASEHPVYELLKTCPNQQMGTMSFREGRAAHQINWGQGFAEIVRNSRNEVVELWPIHPGRVRPVRPEDNDSRGGRLSPDYQYLVRNNDGTSIAMKADEMLHVPGVLSEDGVWGKGVIAYARESVGFGISTERHGAAWFGSRGQPPAVVFAAGLKDKEARANFRREWKEIHGSPDSGEIAILPIEGKYQHLAIPNEDSQFLGTRKHNVTEISRWYRVPPHMLGDLERATFSNIEHLGMEFVIYGLLPWIRRWEEQVNLKLFTPRERGRYFVEHQLAAFLRGDMASRYAAYQTGLMNGWLTVNMISRLENMEPIGPEGDLRFVPVNLVPLHTFLPGAEDPPDGDDGTHDPDASDPGTPPPPPAGDELPAQESGVRSQESGVRSQESGARGQESAARVLPPAREVLLDTLRRLAVKEAKAVERALAQRVDFEPWLDQFYAKHRQVLALALAPALGLLAALGQVVDRDLLARDLCLDSARTLLDAYNSETKAQMAARLAAWPEQRAAESAARILAGAYHMETLTATERSAMLRNQEAAWKPRTEN